MGAARQSLMVWIADLGGTQWDLAPDGKRMVVVRPVESAEARR